MRINRDEYKANILSYYENYFNSSFGDDSDLSELKDINLSDFKIILKKAVEDYIEKSPPEELDLFYNPTFIFAWTYKTVHLILQRAGLNDSLKMLDSESFYDLNNKFKIT